MTRSKRLVLLFLAASLFSISALADFNCNMNVTADRDPRQYPVNESVFSLSASWMTER